MKKKREIKLKEAYNAIKSLVNYTDKMSGSAIAIIENESKLQDYIQILELLINVLDIKVCKSDFPYVAKDKKYTLNIKLGGEGIFVYISKYEYFLLKKYIEVKNDK